MNFDAKEALPGMRAECEAVLRRLPECLVIERALHACSEKIDALSAYTAISSGRVVGRTLLEKACSSVCTLTLLWKQGAICTESAVCVCCCLIRRMTGNS
jgi:hypothetical protein